MSSPMTIQLELVEVSRQVELSSCPRKAHLYGPDAVICLLVDSKLASSECRVSVG